MSLGLIGRYGTDSDSSISDSDDGQIAEPEASCSEETCGNEDNTTARSSDRYPEGRDEAVCVDPLSLGLEDPESSDSEPTTSDSNSETGSPPPNCFQAAVTPLPLPDMDRVVPSRSKSDQVSNLAPMDKGMGMGEGAVENSVFFNPFKKAEEERLAILKCHVEEFDKKPKVTEDPACVASEMGGGYRRRGNLKTGFSRSHHRVAIPPPSSYARHGGSGGRGGAGETHHPMPAAVHHFSSGGPFEGTAAASHPHHHQHYYHSGEPPLNDEEDLVQKPRKHRSGVTNSLMPPKKFMKMHEKIQAKERPWTLK